MATSHGTQRGRTALITGASGGIGEELAKVFAAKGFDLVLVARSQAKLRALADDLAQRHGITATPIAADLSDPAAPAALVADLDARGLTIDALVNNAGYALFGEFAELGVDEQTNLLRLNIVALTELTRRLLPGMIARRRGRILNLASTAAFLPGPLMAIYYASKAYVLSFSEAINEELRGTGVSVTALCPGPTASGFQERAAMEESKLMRSQSFMDAATVAREGYDALMRGRPVVIPGLQNRLITQLPRLLPRRILPRIIRNAQERAH